MALADFLWLYATAVAFGVIVGVAYMARDYLR